MISENLLTLRKMKKLSQEQAAEAAGVSRQAYTRWERGETVPDIKSCAALADFYGVSLDELVNFSGRQDGGLPMPPKGKHLFGVVNVGEKGQIVIPKKARDIFHIKAGDRLIVLGDEQQGIALMPEKAMLDFMNALK
ncbi:MAG: helix-turn-helix domain-containing protein [Eubacterium sp.]|nr:helix-turn-helix domain-containing protein [Eubacterium sp.]MCM1303885.1 helix-turn-helix domain-containing protein [Butyrivibrio sp.]MCM1344840.1 helix-turn-helix domain-containing protein [Muribaculaceae bacterium]MCM1410817.1 helix-turn-helix domain-containing protein [Lachnospiraceae bacterium]